jgi:fructosamine-3-kinase
VTPELVRQVERYTGRKVAGARAMARGTSAAVWQVDLTNGGKVVAKTGPAVAVEGWMLRLLAAQTRMPVPHVIHDGDDLLLMDYVPAGDPLEGAAQRHAAQILADLHRHTWHSFGLDRDTVIGGLTQSNVPAVRWLDFFRDQRLLTMARKALDCGHLPMVMMDGIERLAGRLGNWITEPERPTLVHGDCWGGNILVKGGRVAAFIDPALYYGHGEMDLAFSTMFGTFGDDFFAVYGELNPIEPGFFEERRDLYLLYPLLVHVRLFGGPYVGGVERVLDRFL